MLFHVSLSANPAFQTLKVDETYGATALAGENERIALTLLWAPTESAIQSLFRISYE